MSCSQCRHLPVREGIRNADDLRSLLRLAKAAQREQMITETTPRHVHAEMGCPPVEELPVDGPWADILGYSFRCNACEATYEMTVEISGGQGGIWQRRDAR